MLLLGLLFNLALAVVVLSRRDQVPPNRRSGCYLVLVLVVLNLLLLDYAFQPVGRNPY